MLRPGTLSPVTANRVASAALDVLAAGSLGTCGRAAASSGEGQACPGCTHEEQDAPHTGPQGPRTLVLLLKVSLGFLRVKSLINIKLPLIA